MTMKRTFLLFLVVAFAVTVNAQTSDRKWGLGAGAGAYSNLKDGGIGLIPELYLSRYLSPRLDLMLQGNVGVFMSTVKSNLDLANGFLNLRYKLSNETKKLRPYLYAGPGYLADNTVKGFNFDAGLGAKYYFSPKFAAYLTAGYVNGIDFKTDGNTIHDNFLKSTIGLEFDFGKSKDSDNDGVPDKKDKCPNTPAGVAVDAKGCPIDSDGDGVPDYLDDCPTVAGPKENKGCPLPVNKKEAETKKESPAETKKESPVETKKESPAETKKESPYQTKKESPVETKKGKEGDTKKGLPGDQTKMQTSKGSTIHFSTGKSDLTDNSKVVLDKIIKQMKENNDYNYNIFGHADSQGSDEYNLKLSEQRVESTTQYIKSKGISDSRITTRTAFGESKPIATNDTPEGRLLNRRVEIEIVKNK